MAASRVPKSLYLWLLVSIVVIAFSQNRIESHYEWRYPAVNTLVVSENYTTDLGCLFLGARRLAADIGYIQFLQYYGTSGHEEIAAPHEHHEGESAEEHAHLEEKESETVAKPFPRLKEFGQRIIRLDPYFNAAALEVGGALGFNQKDIPEALSFLKEAIELDPSFYRYRLYMAALLYKNEGQDLKLIDSLAEAMKYKDCPVILKNVLANLYKKYGKFVESGLVRLNIIETAANAGDRDFSRHKLIELIQQHPEIAPALGLTPQ